MPGGAAGYSFSINSTMENFYMVLKDKNGNYLGVANTLSDASWLSPGVQYGPYITLFQWTISSILQSHMRAHWINPE